MSKFGKKLSEIHLARFNQENEFALSEFYKIKSDFEGQEITALNVEDQIAFYALKASIERYRGTFNQSNATLDHADQFLESHNIAAHPLIALERGINLYAQGEYSRALEQYYKVNRLGVGHVQLISKVNICLCLEAMGLPNDNAIHELLGQDSEVKIKGIDNQIDYIKLNQLLKNGDLEKIFKSTNRIPSQSYYLKEYLGQLPYVRSRRGKGDWAKLIQIYQGHGRLNTLRCLIHPRDLEEMPLSDLVDRLYLWFWKWLDNSEEMALEKVVALLNSRKIGSNCEINDQSKAKLRNILNWVELISGKKLKQYLSSLGKIKPDYKILQLENDFILYLNSIKKGPSFLENDLKKILESNKLFDSDYLKFKSILRSPKSYSFMKPLDNQSINGEADFFDLQNRKLSLGEKTLILNTEMSLAIVVMLNNEALSMQSFAYEVFSIHQYDKLVHNAKVWNFLGKVKRTLNGRVDIQTKDGVIFIQWLRPLQLINACKHVMDLQKVDFISAMGKFLCSGKESMNENSDEKNIEKVWVTRADLEKVIKRSRSTAGRMISDLVERGLVVKRGSTRNTRYKFSEGALKHLNDQGVYL